jgi:rod shape-determining protein MreC
MPLGTLDRSPPPFFKQGPSALSKLVFFSALAFLLMVADVRFGITQPLRAVMVTVLHPLQWIATQPVSAAQGASAYFASLTQAQADAQASRLELSRQLVRGGQVEQLAFENQRLRQLLELRGRLNTPATAAEVLYEAADLYTRKVIIDKGQLAGVALGSPVVDAAGVLGQVTRVHPLVSEVTLVVDPDLTIPVLNVRTGLRSVAYGDASGGGLELRFMGSNTDVQEGDLLTTSGVDGIYPPGLPVAKVDRIERRVETAFARIFCKPLALAGGARHVMVLKPLKDQLPPRPPKEEAAPSKGAAKAVPRAKEVQP